MLDARDEAARMETSLRAKLARFARVAGREVVEHALVLYQALRAPSTPRWARTVILGALAYFVLPADTVPDLLPGLGYTDDLGVLAGALATIAAHVTPEMRERARAQAAAWFGESAARCT